MPNGRELNLQVTGNTGSDIQMEVQAGGQGAANTAEAWAVGNRGGVPVASDDPAYNNHAKYWANQAQSAASDAAKYPKIEGGYWYYWNGTEYVNSGVTATWHIVKTYASTSEMNSDFGGTDTNTGDMVMIVNDVDETTNAQIYIKGNSAWQFMVDLSGATGIRGPQGETGAQGPVGATGAQGPTGPQGPIGATGAAPVLTMGTVTTLPAGSEATASLTGTDAAPVLNLGIPKGPSGNESIDDTAGLGDTDLVYSADKVRKELDTKAPAVDVSITTPASVQSFPDGADDLPMALTVGIEPVQDLHGYDNPWPGGGGKNLLPKGTSVSYTGLTFTVNDDGSVKIVADGSATNTYSIDLPVTLENGVTYTASGITGGSSSTYQVYLQTSDGSWTSAGNFTSGSKTWTQNDTNYAIGIYRIRVVAGSTVNTTIYPMIEKGSSATSFAPYSNICPISGWTGCNVYDDPAYGGTVVWNQRVHNGNFASSSNWTAESGVSFSVSNNEISVISSTVLNGVYQSTFLLMKDHVYLFSVDIYSADERTFNLFACAGSGSNFKIAMVKTVASNEINKWINVAVIAKPNVGSSSDNQQNRPIYIYSSTTNATAYKARNYVAFDLTAMFGSTVANAIHAMEQATAGSGVAWFKNLFPKDYYAYNAGETTTVSAVNGDSYRHIAVSFPSSAGTVYGGTLTVNKDGSGELVVDRIGFELNSSKSWVHGSGNRYYYYDPILLYINSSNREYTPICDRLKSAGDWGQASYSYMCIGGTYGSAGICIKLNNNTTMEEFTSWIDTEKPFVVSYLASNVTYQLTTTEVTTLLGQNNLWADTGDISVTYPVDTKLYVDQQIADKISASQRLMELIVTANHEDEMKATKAYSEDELLIVNGTLYKATTSIANGATLTENTNVTATTVAAELAALA